MNTINSAILDWTLCQPLAVSLPSDAVILDVYYSQKYDHLLYRGNPHIEKVTRYFVVGMLGQVFENDYIYTYVGVTVDEEGTAWVVFERTPLPVMDTPKTRRR